MGLHVDLILAPGSRQGLGSEALGPLSNRLGVSRETQQMATYRVQLLRIEFPTGRSIDRLVMKWGYHVKPHWQFVSGDERPKRPLDRTHYQ